MKKVLVVENNPVLLKAVSVILEDLGCDVETACDGLEALECLEWFLPEIIFTDLVMPHVSGEQLSKIIRKKPEWQKIYLVILSAVLKEDLDRILSNIDYNLCIIKGNLPELRKSLIEALEGYEKGVGSHSKKRILNIDSEKKEKFSPSLTSELLLEQHHLNTVLSSLSEGVIELTDEGKVVSANGAAIELLGVEEARLIGMRVDALPLGKHTTNVCLWFENDLRMGKNQSHEIFETDPLELGERYATASCIPVNDNKKSFGIIILRDITRQHLAEQHKRRLNESFRLMKKMEAMAGMAGGVAHDFNNLLTVICGNLDILAYSQEKLEKSELKTLISYAQQAAYAATDLTRKISCFSNFGLVQRQKECIGPIISSTIKHYFSHDHKKYYLDIDTPESLVHIDREQIVGAIENVLINATEAGGKDPIHVKLSTLEFSTPQLFSGQYVPAGKFVRLDIIDKGCGIEAADLLKIFDPYYSTKQRKSDKGIGLGLTVVYATLRNHGGHVVVQSEKGSSTTVSFFLPYFGQGKISHTRLHDEQVEPLQHLVLVLEDQKPIREIAVIMLEFLGYTVSAVSTEEEAIDTLRSRGEENRRGFDVAIVNIAHESSGELDSMCKVIHEIAPSCKIIGSSGDALHPAMVDYHKHGFSGVLPKPYTIDTLHHVLESVLEPGLLTDLNQIKPKKKEGKA